MRQFAPLIVIALALATGAAVALTLGLTTHTARDWFVLLGASYEVASIFLIAAPELWPRALRLAAWTKLIAQRTKERAVAAILRLFRRPRHFTGTLPPIGIKFATGPLRGRVSTSATTLEEQVAYLLQRDRDVQDRFDRLDERVDDLAVKLRGELADAATHLRAHVDERIRQVEDAYINVRLIGVLLLLVGIVLSTVGNLL